jgi:hypothetical protein
MTATKGQSAWQACKGSSGKQWVGPSCTRWSKLQLEFREHKREIKQNLSIHGLEERVAHYLYARSDNS